MAWYDIALLLKHVAFVMLRSAQPLTRLTDQAFTLNQWDGSTFWPHMSIMMSMVREDSVKQKLLWLRVVLVCCSNVVCYKQS